MATDRRIDKIRGTFPISGTCAVGSVWDGGIRNIMEVPDGFLPAGAFCVICIKNDYFICVLVRNAQ